MRVKTNLSCNAWQASNTEGYFAVTGHWIEESITSRWELKSALLGFTQLNNAYDGKRLGQALYKIVERVGIEHKVSTCPIISCICTTRSCFVQIGHITCDNANNNGAMLEEFSIHIERRTKTVFPWCKCRIK